MRQGALEMPGFVALDFYPSIQSVDLLTLELLTGKAITKLLLRRYRSRAWVDEELVTFVVDDAARVLKKHSGTLLG